MSTEIFDLLDAVETRFDTVIATPNSIQVINDNEVEDLDEDNLGPTECWIRNFIVLGDRKKVSANSVNAKYRTYGIGYAHIFGEINKGKDKVAAVADLIDTKGAFRTVTANGVVYDTPSIGQGRREGRWWVVVVQYPFYSDFTD
jgi:hypothetical protein